jgi:hypothetical protein
MIVMNTLSIPFIVINTEWYLWMPLITMLVSPVLGGSYCFFNNLEDHYRQQAGLPVKDRGY